MSKKLLLASLISMLLAGCNQESIEVGGGNPTKPDIIPPEPTPDPEPIKYRFMITSSGAPIEGVTCDGLLSDNLGVVALDYDSNSLPQSIDCLISGTPLATFTTSTKERVKPQDYNLDIANDKISDLQGDQLVNIQSLLRTVDADGVESNGYQFIDGEKSTTNFAKHQADALTKNENDFLMQNISYLNDDKPVGVEPGHGTDVEPEITPGSDDVTGGSGIVSSNAEKQYAYVPEVAVPEKSILVFDGQPVVGIEYYGPTYRGKTGESGSFEYNWGDEVTFGIQALTLGSIKAKGLDIQLGALASDPSKSKNVENLIKQFDKTHSAPWIIEQDVHDRFALESNNIVELINMNLVNADTSSFDPSFGTPPKIEDEFIAQFEEGGSAFDIVSSLELTPINADSYTFSPYVSLRSVSRTETASQALLTMMGQNDADVKNDVTHFHVFGNQNDGYRLPSPHAATFINIDNNAAPVVMPRSDLNAYISFGQLAVTDKFSRPFFTLTNDPKTTPTYIDAKNKTHWNLNGQSVAADSLESSYKMNKETATFELPFVVSGKIGEGKVLVLGNSLYNSILVCPENYSYNSSSKDGVCANGNGTTDSLDMFNFFVNALGWLDTDNRGINIATNRVDGYFTQINGFNSYSFDLNSKFTDLGMTMEAGVSPQSLNVNTNPIYILQAYPVRDRHPDRPDYEAPLIDDNDVNALIDYVNQGGSVLIMESLYNRYLPILGRFLDTAGISSIGRYNVVKFAGKLPSNFIAELGKSSTSLRPVYTEEVYVLEGLAFEATSVDANGIPEKGYKYDKDTNTYSWGDKSINNQAILRALYRPQQIRDEKRNEVNKECKQQSNLADDVLQACINTKLDLLAQEGLDKWISDVQAIYGVPICTNSDYQYQLDCIERREGNGIPISKTTYPGANDMVQAYTRLPMSKDVSNAMIEAANMGTNLTDLYQHELYYRTGGKEGVRLSGIDVDRIYNNLSAWMWNNEQYRYDSSTKDEFGHKTVIEFLNCYSNNTYGNPGAENAIGCPEELHSQMLAKGFLVTVDGINKLNPSYPLNYMEKPLTRMMLGRSYFDVDAKNPTAEDRGVQVDVRSYPGVATTTTPAQNITIHKGSRQSAGVWVPAREVAYVHGLSASDSVMVAMADNLTGRINHEMALNRPPRVSMSFNGIEAETGFKVPYGGSVYITVNSADSVDASFSGSAIAAPMFTMTSATEGAWIKSQSPNETDAPITEIVGNRFSYTTTTAGIKGHSEADILTMAKQFDLFTIGVNEFYGRDEVSGSHKMFTDSTPELEYQNMRLVDDIQISIGSAHSGYPVMSTSFPRQKTESLFEATNNWMLGHEIGHNQATNWLNVAGAGETANNVLALYTQDRNTGDMPRIKVSIKNATEWANGDHPWADGTNADRLNFFGQLKVWAEDNFDIALWESDAKLAEEYSIYNKNDAGQYDQGWNFYKYLHRAARMPETFTEGLNKGEVNYCSSEFAQSENLSNQDMMMICSSFLTGKDIETFFTTWKFGESKVTLQSGDKYSVGISNAALVVMTQMRDSGVIKASNTSPLTINATKLKEVMLPQVPYFH